MSPPVCVIAERVYLPFSRLECDSVSDKQEPVVLVPVRNTRIRVVAEAVTQFELAVLRKRDGNPGREIPEAVLAADPVGDKAGARVNRLLDGKQCPGAWATKLGVG